MHLKCKFDNGEFALLAELQPPKGTDISRMVANIQPVRDIVDAFVVTDMHNAMMHMSALSSVNLLAVTGEDPTFGDHQQALAVHDLDHLDLLYAISGLQNGKDLAGKDLDGSPQFLIGSTVNSNLKGQALRPRAQAAPGVQAMGITL